MDILTAIEISAKDLPPGWTIRLEIQHGSAWVELDGPDGIRTNIDGADMTLAEQIMEAFFEAQTTEGIRQIMQETPNPEMQAMGNSGVDKTAV